jgi:hypothetical protein
LSGATVCANDTSGYKKSSNYAVNSEFLRAKDPLTQAFNKHVDARQMELACGMSPKTSLFSNIFNDGVSQMHEVSEGCAAELRPMRIKKECVKASLNRNSGGIGYTCGTGKPVEFTNREASSACLSNRVVDYITWATNEAIQCMSPPGAPIDPRVVLKKFNSESGFNYFLAQDIGKGIGQLVEDPVLDMGGWYGKNRKTGKTEWNDGNGKPILRAIAASENPACAPFKEIIQDELDQSPPPLPGSKKNYCSWISTGEGFGRSLVYSIGYFLLARDRYVKPALKKAAPKLAENPEVLNYFTLVAYGPKGQSEAKAMIDDLRISNKTTPAKAKEMIRKNSNYVDKFESRMGELQNNLGKTDDEITPEDQRGDTCVQK